MFESLAVPQRGIPYVQMGFRIVLYIRNLVYIDSSDFLPGIQYICWNFRPTCFLLGNMWVRHVSLLWRKIPEYLAVSHWGIWFLLSVTVGQLFRIWVDVISKCRHFLYALVGKSLILMFIYCRFICSPSELFALCKRPELLCFVIR
jgi:hypothetical protein